MSSNFSHRWHHGHISAKTRGPQNGAGLYMRDSIRRKLYFHEGNRYSHACPFARIMESRPTDRLIQIGIRTLNPHQREQAEKFGVEVHEMRHWKDDIDLRLKGPIYISLDLDVFDPAFAPGISHPEPGGLSPREVFGLLQGIRAPVVGADIVEYNPLRDLNDMTAMLAAKCLKELAGKMLER